MTDNKDPEILYQRIIEEYEKNQSIAAIAKKLHTTQVRVQRVLITEGLWTSRRTVQVAELRDMGMTVPEIANVLCIDEKTVQTYLPYSRGQYGGNTTDDSARSREYRDRMRTAAENMHASAEEGEKLIKDKQWEDLLKGAEVNPELKMTYVDNKYSEKPYWDPDSIYKLHLELVSPDYNSAYSTEDGLDLDDKDRADLFRMGKASNGFSRDVLVSGAMTLHAMHYMIQKLFGWQNSHLHSFSLSDDDFERLTEGKVKGWADLCGSLLRFPDGDFNDACWDDDYQEGISVKSWFRRKYNGGYSTKAVGDNWLYNRQRISEFKADCRNNDRYKDESTGGAITDDTLLQNLNIYFEDSYNTLMESLTAGDLFIADKSRISSSKDLGQWKERQIRSLERMSKAVSDNLTDEDLAAASSVFTELKRWRESYANLEHYMYMDRNVIREQTGEEPEIVANYHDNMIRSYEMSLVGLQVRVANEPCFKSIYYNYDYGDDWWVKITCEEIYTDLKAIPFASDESLEEVVNKNKPLCIAADGMNLVDDCGGVYGFLRMLRTINGKDRDEAREMKAWARSLGWTGRIYQPNNML